MKILLLLAISLGMTMVSSSAETRFQSGPAQTVLIELYTSEGCSSCPPAEAWLSRLKQNQALWQQFVPVAFHVDYWDRLGWRDRFSSKEWTARQSRYAAAWGNGSVYTPAVVINGHEERAWSSASPSQPNDHQPGTLTAETTDGRSFALEFHPANGSSNDWEAHLALLGADISTNVRAGENSGRNLKHDFVVLDLASTGMKSDGATARASLAIKSPTESVPRKAVAVWVSRRGQIGPVQAAGGWLP